MLIPSATFTRSMLMRKFYAGLSVAAFVVALAAPAFAKEETVKGQIVDQSCYMKDKASNAGKDHKMPQDVTDCAVSCAKKGAPLALLTSDGKLYTIGGGLAANKNEKLIAAHRAYGRNHRRRDRERRQDDDCRRQPEDDFAVSSRGLYKNPGQGRPGLLFDQIVTNVVVQ